MQGSSPGSEGRVTRDGDELVFERRRRSTDAWVVTARLRPSEVDPKRVMRFLARTR